LDIIWRYQYGNTVGKWRQVTEKKTGNSNIKILEVENEVTNGELIILNDLGTFTVDLATTYETKLKNNQIILQNSRIQSITVTDFSYNSAKHTTFSIIFFIGILFL